MNLRREATWYNVGTDVRGLKTVQDVLNKSKLNYTVEKQAIHLPDGTQIPNKVATVNPTTKHTFGIVSPSYGICQNEDALDFVNYINDDLEFIKAGQTRSGIVYVIGKLPEQFVMGDNYTPYIIFQNGHDGSIPIRASIVPLRVVCQNQFNMAFNKTDSTIRIRHSTNLMNRMEEAKKVLKQTTDYMDIFKKQAEEFSTIEIKGIEGKIIDSFYEIDHERSESYIERMYMKRLELLHAYDTDDNQNHKGTAWGMINAYTDVLTHQQPARQTDNWQEKRFEKVSLDTKDLKKFIAHVKALA